MFLRVLAVVLLGSAVAGAEVMVSVSPASQTVDPGSGFSVDLMASGFTPLTAPSVSSFEILLTFDPSVLAFQNATFGPSLGMPDVESLTDVMPLAAAVDVAEVSLLSSTDLDTLNAGTYSLATLNFSALSGGTSPLALSSVTIDDANGAKIPHTTSDGSVTVIPEPATGLTAAAAIFALIAISIRSKRQPVR